MSPTELCAARDQNVRYVLQHVSNHDDAYYLIKALYDINAEHLIFNDTFLDTKSAKTVRDKIFKDR
jgi:hypothetical protein